jgi:hypothetical protein
MSILTNPILYLLVRLFGSDDDELDTEPEKKKIRWSSEDLQLFNPGTPPNCVYPSSHKSGSTPPILRYAKTKMNNDVKHNHQYMSDEIL